MKKFLSTAIVVSASAMILAGCDPKSNGTSGNTSDIDSATNSDYSITQDEKETLGACEVTSKSAVEAATGKTVKDSVTTGVQNIMGSQSETCIYAFDDVGVTHSFYIDMEEFKTTEELEESKTYSGLSTAKAVTVQGQEAYFTSGDSVIGTTEHVIKIFKDTKKYSLVISIAQDDTSFTTESAEKALLEIAEAAKF